MEMREIPGQEEAQGCSHACEVPPHCIIHVEPFGPLKQILFHQVCC